jgi:hypothetical protein
VGAGDLGGSELVQPWWRSRHCWLGGWSAGDQRQAVAERWS